MMTVVIPVFAMTFWFAWRYRASNERSRYELDWTSAEGRRGHMARSGADRHLPWRPRLALYARARSLQAALCHRQSRWTVQVVAQDWKWLFIYPAQGIATVNELAFPSEAPIRLKITSDTVMNSFFIPALGGQIYAMAGMQTQLNLRANEPGRFVGRNTQYSGRGFADQHFAAVAMTPADFDAWVTQVGQSPQTLDAGHLCRACQAERRPSSRSLFGGRARAVRPVSSANTDNSVQEPRSDGGAVSGREGEAGGCWEG